MRSVTFLIKPASSLCDMRCRYCFYHDISDIREVKSMGIMTEATRIGQAITLRHINGIFKLPVVIKNAGNACHCLGVQRVTPISYVIT